MNIIDFLIIFMIGLYFVSGMYKGFVWSASTFGVSIVACLLAFLLMGTVSNSIIKNEKLYNSMLSTRKVRKPFTTLNLSNLT